MNADLPWNPQQREWLAALGHEVMSLADASPAPVQAEAAPAASAVTRPEARQPERAPASDRPVERAARASPPAPASARSASRGESTLLRALAQE